MNKRYRLSEIEEAVSEEAVRQGGVVYGEQNGED